MMALSHSIVIDASQDAVFAYVTDPAQMAEWLPNMVETHGIVGSGEGQQYEWTYKLAGMLFHGESVVVEYMPSDLAVHQTIGSVSSTWHFRVEPEGDGSKFTLEVSYEVPVPILGRIAEHVIKRRDARLVNLALESVKDLLESAS
jgi:carbon monoxide dehydrogenase subunit G